jgi:hypothetical protein
MDRHMVEEAIHQLQQQGVPLGKITLPQVRERLGSGSYRDIRTHLEAIRAEAGQVDDAGDQKSGSENQRPNTAARTAPDQQDPLELPEDPDPVDDPPSDPLAEAEAALAHAQGQVREAEAQLPTLEHALAEARGQVLAAMGDVLAASAAVQRGFLPRDDPAPALAEAQAKEAARAYQDTRVSVDQAKQRLASWQRQAAEATQRLALAQRERYVATHAPDLWARTQAALTDFTTDPLLQNPRGYANSDVQRRRWVHDDRLTRLEAERAALLDEAEAKGVVPLDPRPLAQRRLISRSRTWI